MLFEVWDIQASLWVNEMQSNFNNNSTGNILDVVIQSWNTTSSIWENNDRISYTYNPSNKVVSAIDEIWIVNTWQNFFKQTFTYDGNNYLVNNISQFWNVTGSTWDNYVQFNYTNNPDGTAFQVVTQLWNVTTLAWDNSQRTTYTYLVLSVTDLAFQNTFTVYPNPAQDKINVKATATLSGLGYSISDQIGRPVLSGILTSSDSSIDSNQLAQGIYFLKIDQFNNQVVKIIKR